MLAIISMWSNHFNDYITLVSHRDIHSEYIVLVSVFVNGIYV